MSTGLPLLVWLHVLSLAGIFGALLVRRFGLPPDLRASPAAARGLSRVANLLLAVGLLTGVGLYTLLHGHQLGARFNGFVAAKLVLLLAVGALLGIGRKSQRADTLYDIVLVLLAAAALLGVRI